MPTTYTGTTGTGQVSNLVQTAYDRLVEHSLRSEPLFRNFADKRPVQVTGPSGTVTLQFYSDMAPATAPLTENVDPDAVALGNTTTVNVSLAEYGNVGMTTRKLELVSLSDVDVELADQIAWNMVNSLDVVAQTAGFSGKAALAYTNVSGTATALTAGSTVAADGTGTTTSTIAAGNVLNSALIRTGVTKLRAGNVQPRKGSLYACVLSPEASADLRTETGAAAWRDPHNYSAAGNIWNGEIGSYEGAFFVESPRVFSGQAGSGGTVRVFNSYLFGQQFAAEAVGEEPHVVFGPMTDSLNRFRKVGWYGFLGWNVYRANTAVQFCTASAYRPTT